MENNVYLRSIPLILEDHENKLLKALYEQQKKSQLCDLSLVVENVSFPAHKCVLAAYSGYFCALFDQGKQSDNAGSKACNVTTIHLSSTTLNSFIPILHYLYTSKLHVYTENIRDVMRTARKLQIHSVLNACEKLLDDNIALASIHKVGEKQSSDTIVTQSNLSESVMYVDLRSDDDDSFQPNQTMLANNQRKQTSSSVVQSADPTIFQHQQLDTNMELESVIDKTPPVAKRIQGLSQSVDTIFPTQSFSAPSAKQKVGRSQKKGFPKKVQQRATSDPQTSPTNYYATVSPASIFGRVNSSSTIRSRKSPSISSPDTVSKSSVGAPFEGNLEALNAMLGADSALLMDMQNEVSNGVKAGEKQKTQNKTSAESIQLHSVFSMSPASTQRATMSSADWSRIQNLDASTAVVSSTQAIPANFTPSIPVLQNSLTATPSVYTCKECFKYFTNLSEALHHFYSEHQTSTTVSNVTSLPLKPKPSSYTCPHCSRVFNNKNNLKRHILIKHTSDKRFKCSLCGRRYAIRQSLQYHMKSVHGLRDTRSAIVNATPVTSTYQFEPVSESNSTTIDTFSFTTSVTNTAGSLLETFQPITNPNLLPPTTFFTSESIDEATRADKPDSGMPMIENIRSVAVEKEKELPRQQVSINKPQKDRKSMKNFSKKSFQGDSRLMKNLPLLSDLPANSSLDIADHPVQVVSDPQQSLSRPAPEATLRLHRCDHCSRIFSTIHAYTRHKRTCHKHECPICHRGFSQIGNMRRHMKIFHCEQKPYQCHICHKAYGIKQSFRYHMRDKHGSSDVSMSSRLKPRQINS